MKTRILAYDIETSPLISYTWGTYQTDVIEVIEDYQILTVAWQWVGEKKVHVIGQDDFKGYKPGVNDDTELVKFIHTLYCEADAVVGHNSISFDDKKVQTRMLIRGLPPPTPYKQIDTKRIAKRIGSFTSNKLKDLAKDLSVAQKGQSGGFETWKGCLAGNPKAWKQMKKYNKQDIPPLVDLYLKFRPWDKQAIPLNVMESRPESCPKCAGDRMTRCNTYTHVKTGAVYEYYRCMALGCGGMAKRRVPIDSFKKVEYVS
jgi:hypothetical protein